MRRALPARLLKGITALLAALAALALLTLALPVPAWRTGEPAAAPLILHAGTAMPGSDRVWIDTDAACGSGPRTDPDDCLALLLLIRAARVPIAGVTVVEGNASLALVERTARELLAALQADGYPTPPLYGGAQAAAALRAALESERLVILALGPLTNVARALHERPDLTANIERVVAVMGKRKDHLFHPSEGRGDGMLFGHGPVFRDFNLAKDPEAAQAVAASGIPMVLIPYEAARSVVLSAADMERLRASGGAGAWVAERTQQWQAFWREDIGLDGFYPFDLLAAGYVIAPALLRCADAVMWMRPARGVFRWMGLAPSLEVGLKKEKPEDGVSLGKVTYCPRVRDDMDAWLSQRLAER